MTWKNIYKLSGIFLMFILFFSSCNIKFISHFNKVSKKKLQLVDKTFTTSDGYEIAYSDNEVMGKPTMFFLHGYFSARYNFFPLAKKFPKGDYRYIFVDIPAFGESSKFGNGDYKISSQARRMNELISHLKLKNVHLVGTSLGGAICIEMNGKNKSILSSTLIAPYGMPLYTQELPKILEHFIETGQAVFIVDNPYDQKRTKKLFHFASNKPSFFIPPFILKEIKDIFKSGREATNKVAQDILYDKSSVLSVAKEHPKYSKIAKELKVNLDTLNISSPKANAAMLNMINKSKNIKETDPIGDAFESVIPSLKKINNPVLVLWGTKDNIIHYKTMETMKPFIKNGKYIELKNGTHSISIFKAKKIAKEMKKILNNN